MGKQFSARHVAAVATLVEFTDARHQFLKTTPIAANPTLFERAQHHHDDLYDKAMASKGPYSVDNQMDSVLLDNLAYEEIDRRRDLRRAVIQRKRAFLTETVY